MSASLIKKVSPMVPRKVKIILSTWVNKKNVELPTGLRAFIFLAADYGNIGDLAITAAQDAFLSKTLGGYTVIRVPISKTRTQLQSIKKQIKPRDLVTIIGGGNMGTMYPDIEELRQLVIRSFPCNRIVCFPQTLDWGESPASSRALQRIVKVYSRHPDIHVCVRESITRNKLTELFKHHSNVNVCWVPDIVMSATAGTLGARDCTQPSGILRCLRDDRESLLSAEQYANLDAALANTGYPIEKTDTHAGGMQLDEAHCAQLLADKLSQFRKARLVVTDRLHGMILCLLAGTPCLVLPNANHKIRQTWLDWLNDHPRLAFVEPEQLDEIPALIDKLLSESRGELNKSPVELSNYASLKQALTRS